MEQSWCWMWGAVLSSHRTPASFTSHCLISSLLHLRRGALSLTALLKRAAFFYKPGRTELDGDSGKKLQLKQFQRLTLAKAGATEAPCGADIGSAFSTRRRCWERREALRTHAVTDPGSLRSSRQTSHRTAELAALPTEQRFGRGVVFSAPSHGEPRSARTQEGPSPEPRAARLLLRARPLGRESAVRPPQAPLVPGGGAGRAQRGSSPGGRWRRRAGGARRCRCWPPAGGGSRCGWGPARCCSRWVRVGGGARRAGRARNRIPTSPFSPQILEEVCRKQGGSPAEYGLK